MNKIETLWEESFLAAIAEAEEKTGVNPVDWRVSGRESKQWPDKENKAWWDVNGKQMFMDFITAWRASGLKIWISPEGVPGIEIGFNNKFGDVPVRAFADAIAVMPDGELAVIDFKTGSYVPSSGMQLGIYASMMEMQFGIRPTRGFYYNARKAQFVEAYGVDRWNIPVLTEMFTKFNLGVENEIFLPNVGMACNTCGVREYCYAMGGQLSTIYDPLAEVAKKKPETKPKVTKAKKK